jgi:adenosylcobinamide-phosphate synthase
VRVVLSAGAPLLTGFALDLVAGDPERWHPVAGFGTAAATLERAAYAPSRARGALIAGVLVGGAAAAGELLARGAERAGLEAGSALGLLTWTALGGASLRREAARVAALAAREDLEPARHALRSLCGRDATGLGRDELARAICESLAENTADAVTGALLWGALAGPAGVAGYRAANTLDAMFGHHSARYEEFGWAAARLDDVLGWPAARLTAALACLLAPIVAGNPSTAARIAIRDGSAHPSPNAGRAEAAFAGALGLRFGGTLAYAGRTEDRATLGDGRAPALTDVARAARLSLAVGVAAALVCAAFRGMRS